MVYRSCVTATSHEGEEVKETPILYSNADKRLNYKRALRKAMRDLPNPYESDMHKEAQEWLAKHNLSVRSLRK